MQNLTATTAIVTVQQIQAGIALRAAGISQPSAVYMRTSPQDHCSGFTRPAGPSVANTTDQRNGAVTDQPTMTFRSTHQLHHSWVEELPGIYVVANNGTNTLCSCGAKRIPTHANDG